MEKFITREADRQYCLVVLEKYPQIIKYSIVVLLVTMFYQVYVSLLYAHYDCEGWGYSLFALINVCAFFFYTRFETANMSRLRVTSLVLLVQLILSANLIQDQRRKTICDVTVCHSNNLLQENIDVIIQAMKRKDNFCYEMRMYSRDDSNEEAFEDMYLNEIQYIWEMLCTFYDNYLGLGGNGNCNSTINADRVFSNYQLKILKLFTGFTILLLLATVLELVLQAIYPAYNHDGSNVPQETFFAETKSNQNPLLEFYRRSSEFQKNTAVFLQDDSLEQHHSNANHHHQLHHEEMKYVGNTSSKMSFGHGYTSNSQMQNNTKPKSTNPFDD